jgi:NAD(P)-dependent dehydrogenase (short-subunit alcohol dehydrogenase family)
MPQRAADTPAQAPRKVALVTGASRGIGKAIAVELANAGYDVAIIARTVHEGEAREHSSTLKRSDTSPLPGSLDATSALIQAAGARCVALQADLLDHPSLVHAAATVLAEWGHVDVLVNNGRYIGPGHMDHILDTPVRVLRDHLEANALAPVVLVKEVVPQMIERGGGTVINITSTVASSRAQAVGVSATRSARARSIASPASSPSSSATRMCGPTTCNRASSRPSACNRTWARSVSTRPRAPRSR